MAMKFTYKGEEYDSDMKTMEDALIYFAVRQFELNRFMYRVMLIGAIFLVLAILFMIISALSTTPTLLALSGGRVTTLLITTWIMISAYVAITAMSVIGIIRLDNARRAAETMADTLLTKEK